MGCYDSLYIGCPSCGAELEFQSKSGECCMGVHGRGNLPADVAVGMNGDIVTCLSCKKNIKLECGIPEFANVNLILTSEESDYN